MWRRIKELPAFKGIYKLKCTLQRLATLPTIYEPLFFKYWQWIQCRLEKIHEDFLYQEYMKTRVWQLFSCMCHRAGHCV